MAKVTTQDALEVTGSLSYEMMDRLMQFCEDQAVPDALETLRQLLSSGKEARRLLENLLVYCRDLLLYQQAPQLLEEKITADHTRLQSFSSGSYCRSNLPLDHCFE